MVLFPEENKNPEVSTHRALVAARAPTQCVHTQLVTGTTAGQEPRCWGVGNVLEKFLLSFFFPYPYLAGTGDVSLVGLGLEGRTAVNQ